MRSRIRHHRALVAVGNDELVLQEPPAAVQPAPVGDGIERVEERRDGLRLRLPMTRRLAEPRLVEEPHGGPGDESARGFERDAEPGVRRQHPAFSSCRHLVSGQVLPGRQHRPPQTSAAGERVDPGHGVGGGSVGLAHRRHQLGQVADPVGVHLHPPGRDRQHVQDRLDDDPGEPHATDGCPEQLGVLVGTDGAASAVAEDDVQRPDVLAEAADAMVVLAVDVGCDGAADGHEARPRSHHHEEPPRKEVPHQLVQVGPGGDAHGAGLRVQPHHGRKRQQDLTSGVLGSVAVGTPQASGDQAAVSRRLHHSGKVLGPATKGPRHGGRSPPPASQRH